MAWVKLDDGFFRHTKVVRAGRDARDLYLAGLCSVAANLTDGFIPAEALRQLAADAQVGQPKRLAERLVTVGLWEASDGGFLVHDYLEFNPSRERVLATRSVRAELGARGGRKSGEIRKQTRKQIASVVASHNHEAKSNPVPVPVPLTSATSIDQPENTDTEKVVTLAVAPSARAQAVPKQAIVPKPHQAMIAALGDALGVPKTRGDWSKYATAAADLCRAGAEPESVSGLVDRWGALFPGATCTPFALANNYAALVSDRRPSNGRRREEPRGFDGLREAFADLDPRRAS